MLSKSCHMLSNSFYMLLKEYNTVICCVRNLIYCVKLGNICIVAYFSDENVEESSIWASTQLEDLQQLPAGAVPTSD